GHRDAAGALVDGHDQHAGTDDHHHDHAAADHDDHHHDDTAADHDLHHHHDTAADHDLHHHHDTATDHDLHQHDHHDHAAVVGHRHGVPPRDGEHRLVEHQGQRVGPIHQLAAAPRLARGAVLQPAQHAPEPAQ